MQFYSGKAESESNNNGASEPIRATPSRKPESPSSKALAGEPNFQPPARPIADLLSEPGFPESALGRHVDIGGYAGVVVAIVKHSIKVRSAEGTTMSYNVGALHRLYGPRVEPPAPAPAPEPTPAARPAAPPAPTLLEPNFDLPMQPIESFVARPDYPQCALGQFLDLHGFEGVVVGIVNGSLKIRSREGATRSYNANSLRALYTKK